MSFEADFDLFIIGGGINGAAVANHASAAGLTVGLCDQLDFAEGTSGASTKLIHGGLRYLEQREFSLVREALTEQKLLRAKAPHIVHPLEIYMPDAHRLRKPWQVGVGLFIYDYLASRRTLPPSQRISFPSDSSVNPLNLSFKKGYSFYDCTTQDARLVIENLLAASQQDTKLFPHYRCNNAERKDNHWVITCQSTKNDEVTTFRAKMLVNATGPWAGAFLTNQMSIHTPHRIRLVKGSHLVFPKLYEGSQAYLLQNIDGRVIFVLPFLDYFTVVGTTEVPFEGDPKTAHIEPDEIYYLCDAINRYFHHRIMPRDVVGSWSGVRPLLDNNRSSMTDLTRSAKIELNLDNTQDLPLINIFGGKLTTHRALAEKVITALAPYSPKPLKKIDPKTPLPGGKISAGSIDAFKETVQTSYPWLPEALLNRYVFTYGQRTLELLDGKKAMEDLGSTAGYSLTYAEAKFLIENEWATCLDDILYRRTQLGYFFAKPDYEKARVWWDEQIF